MCRSELVSFFPLKDKKKIEGQVRWKESSSSLESYRADVQLGLQHAALLLVNQTRKAPKGTHNLAYALYCKSIKVRNYIDNFLAYTADRRNFILIINVGGPEITAFNRYYTYI